MNLNPESRYQPVAVTQETASFNVQSDSTDFEYVDAPGPGQLTRLCAAEPFCGRVRSLGGASLGAGLTSMVCREMMKDHTKHASGAALITVGLLLNLVATFPRLITLRSDQRASYLKQCLGEVLVPALTATSVYLALSHDYI